MTTETVLKTALHSLHQAIGARMVPFAGYDMPVQYPLGVKSEHLFCRENAGLFDVSHMGQVIIEGSGVIAELERLIPIDIDALQINQQSYGLFTNEQGGILDDLIITRWGEDRFFLVINAGCKTDDIKHLKAQLSENIRITELTEQALVALQGPKAKDVMETLCPDANRLTFMNGCHAEISIYEEKAPVFITRSGYTGEDGFEISVANVYAENLAQTLLSFDAVEAIGLGARDSLRLEAGLCLYGHDLSTETTPTEAALNWSISKSRRLGGSKEGGFIGSEIVLEQLQNGANRKRVGLDLEGRAPVREGAIIEDLEGNPIGAVTSGGFSPTMGCPIAMGYVERSQAEIGTAVNAIVRGKALPAKICKLPFVAQNYFRGF